MHNPVVLIIAQPEDVHAEIVFHRLEKNFGKRCLIINPFEFPGKTKISSWMSREGEWRFIIEVDDTAVSDKEIGAVWWRRYSGHNIPETVEGQEAIQFAKAEARQLFFGLFAALGERVINNPIATAYADNKIVQLMHARQCGLNIPNTLMTNSVPHLEEFFSAHSEDIIFKPFTQIKSGIAETRKFDSSYLSISNTLEFAPCIFQNTVHLGKDIRATIVGDEVFSVGINAENPEAKFDWRLDQTVTTSHYELPEGVAERLVKLSRKLGLVYGAADLRIDDSGNCIFFEINPGGQFLFCEIHGNQPISTALARKLIAISNA